MALFVIFHNIWPNRRDCDAVGHQPAAEGAREVGEGPPALVIVVGRTGGEFWGTQRVEVSSSNLWRVF